MSNKGKITSQFPYIHVQNLTVYFALLEKQSNILNRSILLSRKLAYKTYWCPKKTK